jgi:ribosomal RNA-processing protein 7
MKATSTSSAFVHLDLVDSHRVIPVKFAEASVSAHQIFFKPHRVASEHMLDESKPVGRTLFASNVPAWASPDSIKRVFQANGAVESVILQKAATSGPPPAQTDSGLNRNVPDTRVGFGFKYAYIVFERPSSVHKTMEKMDVSFARVLSTKEHPIETGVNKWRQEYNNSICPNMADLMDEIETSVTLLDRRKEEEVKRAEAQNQPDDDGWVTVSRHTSKKPVGKLEGKAQAKVKAREARKRKRRELENFYKHQLKESKLRKLDELKQKFESDKKKQLQMKQDRKFKPA